MADKTITILIGTTKTTLTIQEWIALKDRISVALNRSKVRCGACGRLTLPFAQCEACGCSR